MYMYIVHKFTCVYVYTACVDMYNTCTEVGCRDDTVLKTVDTRRYCGVGLRACNNLPQPPKTEM